MFGPDWDAGCPSCSLEADHAEGALVHLKNHDVAYVRISRAPLEKLEAYKRRMGWTARWVSSLGSDFNYDFHVSFTEDQLAGMVEYNYALIDGYHRSLAHFTRVPGEARGATLSAASERGPVAAIARS